MELYLSIFAILSIANILAGVFLVSGLTNADKDELDITVIDSIKNLSIESGKYITIETNSDQPPHVDIDFTSVPPDVAHSRERRDIYRVTRVLYTQYFVALRSLDKFISLTKVSRLTFAFIGISAYLDYDNQLGLAEIISILIPIYPLLSLCGISVLVISILEILTRIQYYIGYRNRVIEVEGVAIVPIPTLLLLAFGKSFNQLWFIPSLMYFLNIKSGTRMS